MRCLTFVRDGDTVVVHLMDRLARTLDDLRTLVRTLTLSSVRVQFAKEQLTFTGEDTAMATLLMSVLGAFDEFEGSLSRKRQREGTAPPRKRGAYRTRPGTDCCRSSPTAGRSGGQGSPGRAGGDGPRSRRS
jgi:DNA invertase Pin-like site-specific DNA recombinase